jgi:hypothetical protein
VVEINWQKVSGRTDYILSYHNFNLKKTFSVFNFFYYNIAECDYGTEEECTCQVWWA